MTVVPFPAREPQLPSLAALSCRLCGAACTAEGAVFAMPEDDSPLLSWCGPVCAGRHGLWPWHLSMPQVRAGVRREAARR